MMGRVKTQTAEPRALPSYTSRQAVVPATQQPRAEARRSWWKVIGDRLAPASESLPAQAASFGLALLKRWSSPIRSFGTKKVLLFGAFNATLFAAKVDATVTTGQWLINAAMSEPSTGQMVICAATVGSLVGANLYALVFQGRAKERWRQAVLAVIANPGTDPAVREKLLAELEG